MRTHKRWLTAGAVLVALFLVSVIPASADPGTVYVHPGGTDVWGCGDHWGPAFACKTINYAVNNVAAPFDIVQVADGTYTEDIVIPFPGIANLTIQSDNGAGVTTIQGVAGITIDVQGASDNFTLGGAANKGFTVVGNAAASTFLLQITHGASGVTISYNDFDTTGNATHAISVGAAGAADLTIEYNNDFYLDNLPTDDDVAVALHGPMTNLLVDNNVVDGLLPQWGSAVFFDPTSSADGVVISNNTFIEAWVELRLGAANFLRNITISDNTFDADTDGRGAIFITEDVEAAPERLSDLAITGNTFQRVTPNAASYALEINGAIEDTDLDYDTITFTCNNILDEGAAGAPFVVDNHPIDFAGDGIPDLFAEGNWWGTLSGPLHPSNTYTEPGGVAQYVDVSGNVDFVPWLDGTCGADLFAPVYLNVTEGYASIQGAIDDAAPTGSTIDCAAGTFTESVLVNKSLPITGAPLAGTPPMPTTILDANGGHGFEITVSNVTIDGFEVRNVGSSGVYAHGTALNPLTKLLIQNNWLYDSATGHGVHFDYVDDSLIRFNEIGDATKPNAGNGILIEDGDNDDILANEIHHNKVDGVKLDDCSNIDVGAAGLGNSIHDNVGKGVDVDPCSNVRIQYNYIHDNMDDGIFVLDSSVITIDDNDIYENWGDGVDVDPSTDLLMITDNWIYDNAGNGVELFEVTTATIARNRIYETAGVPIQNDGINLHDCTAITIGGATVADENLIYDNTEYGIQIEASPATTDVDILNNEIMNNVLGGINIDDLAATDIVIRFNYILANAGTPALESDCVGAPICVDARNNWFGDSDLTCSLLPIADRCLAGDLIVDNGPGVGYTPWWSVDPVYVDDDYYDALDPAEGRWFGLNLQGRRWGYDAYPYIQWAIDAVGASTVNVAEGLYGGDILVFKTVDLLGAGSDHEWTVLPTDASVICVNDPTPADCGPDGWGLDPAPDGFQIVENDVLLQGFYIEEYNDGVDVDADEWDGFALAARDVDGVVINDVQVRWAEDDGIRLDGCTAPSWECTNFEFLVTDVTVTGCNLRENHNNGIDIDWIFEATISGNAIFNNGGDGVHADPSGDLTFLNNNVQENDEDGFEFEEITGLYMEGNTVWFNEYDGIDVEDGSSDVQIGDDDDMTPGPACGRLQNDIRGNGDNGIEAQDLVGINSIEDNVISGNGERGVYVDESEVTLLYNQIEDNHWEGVMVEVGLGVATAHGNMICGNDWDGFDVEVRNAAAVTQDFEYNWYCADPPGASRFVGPIDRTPWLTLETAATPDSLMVGEQSLIEATIADGGFYVPNCKQVDFLTAPPGSFNSNTAYDFTDEGIGEATLTCTGVGTAGVDVSFGVVTDTLYVECTVGLSESLFLSADPASIVANGVDTSTLRAEVQDAGDNPVVDGTIVRFVTNKGSVGSLTIDVPTVNGVAEATLTADTVAGTATVTATAQDLGAATDSVDVEFLPGPPAWIDMSAVPNTLPANGTSTSLIEACVTDLFNNPVALGTMVQFNTTLGNVTPATGLTGLDGCASTTLTAGTTIGTAHVTATAGSASDWVDVPFTPLPSATLDLSANPASIVANGVDTSALTAVVEDAGGNPVANGTIVRFVTNKGSVGSLTIDVPTLNGVAVATLTADTVAGTATVTATAQDAGLATDTVQVTFRAGPPDSIDLTADPTQIFADGLDTSLIEATVTDQFGNNVLNGTVVTFNTTLGSLSPGTATTVNGVASTTLTAGTVVGNATVSASSGSASSSVVVPIISPVFFIELGAEPASVPANGTTASTITAMVTLDDGVTPVPDGTMVTFFTDLGFFTKQDVEVDVPTAFGEASVELYSDIAGYATVGASSYANFLEEDRLVTFIPRKALITYPPHKSVITERQPRLRWTESPSAVDTVVYEVKLLRLRPEPKEYIFDLVISETLYKTPHLDGRKYKVLVRACLDDTLTLCSGWSRARFKIE